MSSRESLSLSLKIILKEITTLTTINFTAKDLTYRDQTNELHTITFTHTLRLEVEYSSGAERSPDLTKSPQENSKRISKFVFFEVDSGLRRQSNIL